METRTAILSFSQSEKIKAGLLWVNHAVEQITGLPGMERSGADRMVLLLLEMVAGEITLAKRLTNDEAWGEALKHTDKALTMIRSQVVTEAPFHLTKALSQVTGIGHRSMSDLTEKGLL